MFGVQLFLQNEYLLNVFGNYSNVRQNGGGLILRRVVSASIVELCEIFDFILVPLFQLEQKLFALFTKFWFGHFVYFTAAITIQFGSKTEQNLTFLNTLFK